MRQIDAIEYEQVPLLALDREQRDALLACGGDLSLAPEAGTEALWRLRTGSHVGSVVAPGLTLRIRPKLSIARLFVMLSAAGGSIQWDDRTVGLARTATIEDVVGAALVSSIRRCLAMGLLRGYVTVEEESFVVRGRLDVAESIRRRPASVAPFVQHPEFLDEDIPENRVLATALDYLGKRVSSADVRARVAECQRVFAGVSVATASARLPRVSRTRLNARWWGAIDLALLVLKSSGLDIPLGPHLSRAFLVDMNSVFEMFVHRALADELRGRGLALEHNRGGIPLDRDAYHSLRPDLSLWAGKRCLFAGDCKYKYAEEAIARREDIYQCLAYSAATGVPRVTLVYGGGVQSAREVTIVDGRTTIRVRTLDLAASSDHLRAQFAALATEIVRDL